MTAPSLVVGGVLLFCWMFSDLFSALLVMLVPMCALLLLSCRARREKH